MQYENNSIDPKRVDELVNEILYGRLPDSEIPLKGIIGGKSVADQDATGRHLAFGALQRGQQKRRLRDLADEQATDQESIDLRQQKRTSRRTSF